ncbi:hypothetical protein [Furfurilactobacillus entadae]|uniref:hypothetical protein n=1 Tax=Furfurilactobacillus entadae TaxID=2922307 RepID=UPI0035E7C198
MKQYQMHRQQSNNWTVEVFQNQRWLPVLEHVDYEMGQTALTRLTQERGMFSDYRLHYQNESTRQTPRVAS